MPRQSIVELDTRRLNRILKNLPGNTSNAVGRVAFSVERKAKMKAPVDTGALRASIYTRVGTRRDGFPQATAGVSSRDRDEQLVELPEPENNHTAHVGPAVTYGVDVELGTHRQAAQPYLTPAVRETEQELARMFQDVVTDG